MTPQQQRALEIANAIIGTAYSMVYGFKEPVPNANLLRKRAFPDRKIPHRVKRELKKRAKKTQAALVNLATLRAYFGVVQIQTIQSQPMPDYPSGGNQNV